MAEKKTYAVTYRIRGYATALVEAESAEEALRMVDKDGDGELVLDEWEASGAPSVEEA